MRTLLVSACLAALAALGFLFWKSDSNTRGAGGALENTSAPDSLVPEERAATDLPAAPVQERAAERSAIESRSTGSTAAVASASAARAGSRVIGRVLDTRGRPLVGADVQRAETRLFGATSRPPDDAPGIDGTTTDAEGRFSLAVGSENVALRFGADGFEWLRRSVLIPAGATVDLGELELADGVQFSGRVIDALGQPVADALISRQRDGDGVVMLVDGEDQGEHLATSGADGGFAVRRYPAGSWALVATHPRYPRQTLEGESLQPGERRDGLVITLLDGVSLAGIVSGLPAGGRDYTVRAQPVGAKGTSIPIAIGDLDFTGGGRSGVVRTDGSFEVQGLAPAEAYRIALHEGASVGKRRSEYSTVVAHTRDARLDYARGASVNFHVVDARTQAPLERFAVEYGFGWLNRHDGEDMSALRPGGAVQLNDLWRTNEGARLHLKISAQGYGSIERNDIEVTPGATTDLGAIALTPVPIVEVHVVDQRGDPVEGASVVLTAVQPAESGRRTISVRSRLEASAPAGSNTPEDNDNQPVSFGDSSERALTDADGRATLNSTPGKMARVTVAAEGYADWVSGALELPAAGVLPVAVVLTQGGRVVVQVLDRAGTPAPGVKIERRRTLGHSPFDGDDAQDARRTRVTDARGEARFEDTAVGRQGFRVAPKSAGGMTFVSAGAFGLEGDDWTELNVDEGGQHTLLLALPVSATLVGRVFEDDRPLSGARVGKAEAGGLEAFALLGGNGGATADGGGRFRLENLEPGALAVEVKHPSRAMPARFDLVLVEGENEVRLDLAVSVIEGRVTDAEGKAVAGAKMTAERSLSSGENGPVRVMIAMNLGDGEDTSMAIAGFGGSAPEVLTDAEGRYSLRGVVADTELVVKAEREGFREAKSQPLHVAPGAVRGQIDLVLEAGGALRVSCDKPGQWLALASPTGAGAVGGPPKVGRLVDGVATFKDLTPGTWSVRLNSLGEGEEPAAVEPKTVEVKSGETAELRFDK